MPEQIEDTTQENIDSQKPLVSDKDEYLQFGGMAVPEGVMMRSPHYYAVACRAPNNEIIVKTEPLEETWIGRQKWLKKPFLRGTLALLDTMALGNKAMSWATGIHTGGQYAAEESEEERKDKKPEKEYPKWVESILIGLTVVVSLGVAFVIFKAIPEFLAQGALQGVDPLGYWTNLIAGLVKLTLFIGYLAVIRRMPAILEVFKYHGAEHKAINAVEEHGTELKPDICMAQTRLHPRCGTNFAIIVLLIGFFVFLAIPRYPTLFGHKFENFFEVVGLRIGLELILLPTIAGISYEIIRAAGKAKDQKWVEILLKPGLATQLITTAEPEEKHIEVAIRSLKAVLKAEESGELENNELKDAEHAAEVNPGKNQPEDILT